MKHILPSLKAAALSLLVCWTGSANELRAPSAFDPLSFCGTGQTPLASQEDQGLRPFASAPPAADTLPEPVIIDLLVVYTSEAIKAAGGEDVLREAIDRNVASANTSFIDSKINARINLIQQTAIPYTESGSLLTDSSRLLNGQSGLEKAHTLRAAYKADVVCLIIDQDAMGIGGQASDVPTIAGNAAGAFVVLRRNMLNYPLVFTHELGHLLGCSHSRADLSGYNPNDSFYKARFPYSFGNRWEINGVTYADIMTYPPGVHHHVFASPDTIIDGVPTGLPDTSATPANTAKTVNQLAPVVAKYRSAASRIEFVDSSQLVFERDQSISVFLKRTGDLRTEARVTVTVNPKSTAVAGQDYTLPASMVVVFPANEASAEFSLNLMEDDILEPSRTIILNLASPSGAHGLGKNSSFTFQISDNQADIRLAMGLNYEVMEGTPELLIPAQHQANITSDTLVVPYQIIPGTALPGSDYRETPGQIVLNSNWYDYLRIPIIDDDLPENDESFTVQIAGFTLHIRVLDNDHPGRLIQDSGSQLHTWNSLAAHTGMNVLSRADGRLWAWGQFNKLDCDSRVWDASCPPAAIALLEPASAESSLLRPSPLFTPLPITSTHRQLDGIYDPAVVHTLLPLSDGRIVLGGQFSRIGTEPAINLAVLDFNGAIASDFNRSLSFSGPIYTLAKAPGDSIYVGGLFSKLNATSVSPLVRLNREGAIDTEFTSKVRITNPRGKPWVNTIAVHKDGRIIVGGAFTAAGGITSSNLVRLNQDGSRDSTFRIGNAASDQVNAIAIQPDGRIIVAGHFENFSSRLHRRIVRLLPDGTVDPTFKSPNPNNEIRHLLLLPDSRILLSGLFTSIGSSAQRFLALLKPDGSLDTSVNFGTGPNNVLGNDILLAFGDQAAGSPFTIAPDGSLYLSGGFTSFDRQPTSQLIRLDLGVLQPAFGPPGKFATRFPIPGISCPIIAWPGAHLNIESTSDFKTWTRHSELTITDSPAEFIMPTSENHQSFRLTIGN